MTIPTDTVLRAVASLLWTDGEINQNVFNCLITGGGGPFDEQDVIDDLEDWFDNMYANLTTGVSDGIDGNEILVYKYDAGGGDWDEVGTQAWTWNPTGSQEWLPKGNAGLINLKTVDPDVSGKKYIGGLTEGIVADGLLGGSFVTSLLAFGADWLTPFVGAASGATFTPGVWSVAGTVFKAAVDHIIVPTIVAYQRRRKNNVGI